jgi:hypothetical protein
MSTLAQVTAALEKAVIAQVQQDKLHADAAATAAANHPAPLPPTPTQGATADG